MRNQTELLLRKMVVRYHRLKRLEELGAPAMLLDQSRALLDKALAESAQYLEIMLVHPPCQVCGEETSQCFGCGMYKVCGKHMENDPLGMNTLCRECAANPEIVEALRKEYEEMSTVDEILGEPE